MSPGEHQGVARYPLWHILTHKHVLSGLMFVSIAILGLWLSRDYPIGTALRMGTGYVPRLLCWILLALGCLILFQGLRESRPRGIMVDVLTPPSTLAVLAAGYAPHWHPSAEA